MSNPLISLKMNNPTYVKLFLTLIIGQFLLFCPYVMQAQTADKIYKKDSSVLSAKIAEITADTIFYKANAVGMVLGRGFNPTDFSKRPLFGFPINVSTLRVWEI
jgi:hypothetical protein